MQPPKSNVCVICGVRPATTQDHVPPKGLFKGLGVPLITVPACAECNNGAASDDEDLRFFVSMQVGKQTTGSARLWDQGAHKSVKRKAALRNQVLSTAREIATVREDGSPVTKLVVEVQARVYDSVFGRTTRGLYFFHTGRILSPQTRIAVHPRHSKPEDELFLELHQNEIGGQACKYWFWVDSDDTQASRWLYEFYGLHWVRVATGAICDDDA